MSDATSPYPCPDCDQSFGTKVGLSSHRRIHKPLLKCATCGEEVKSLEMHQRKVHPEQLDVSEMEVLKTQNLRLKQVIGRLERENKAYRSKLGKLLRSGIRV